MISGRRECTAVLLTLLAWWSWAGCAHGQESEINIVGLSEGKAVVAIGTNGKPKVVRDGERLPNGAKLVKAMPDSAVFEIDGKRRTLTMASRVSAGPSSGGGGGRVTLVADGQGHFVTVGSINGASVRFLVDTGATLISIGLSDARRIGLEYLKGEQGFSRTANGVAKVYKVRLDTVKIGDITLNGVDALVHEADLPWALLGMSFLNRVEMMRQGDDLTLVKRY